MTRGCEEVKVLSKKIEQLSNSERVDPDWYLRSYPDVAALKMDPAEHYLLYGKLMRRRANAGVKAPPEVPPPAVAYSAAATVPEADFRIFDRGSAGASPENQRRVGALASFPPRRESLRAAVESILPQLDELNIYLNNYDDVPAFLLHPKIRVARSHQAAGDLRDNGKFYALPEGSDAYIFTLDDDIIYPPDYVTEMIRHIELLGRAGIVGVHGVIFPEGEFVDLRQRTVFKFDKASEGRFVDLLGTGTTAWHSSTLKVGLQDFGTTGVCDLWFARKAAGNEIPMYSVPRAERWLQSYMVFQNSLFREARKAPHLYFDVFRKEVLPALERSNVRKRVERHLATGFDHGDLAAVGMGIGRRRCEPVEPPACNEKPKRPQLVHFHIVVNGWNCRDFVESCLRSIASQQFGPYTYEVTLIDDGSNDGTFELLRASNYLPYARLLRIARNSGPAYARHMGIKTVGSPETVVALLDMDDSLEPHALKVVAERYLRNPRCLMTIGNWHDQNGKRNPQSFYSAEEINTRAIRRVREFNATHLRTFRRKLYDAVSEEDLVDAQGKWLETCTDVAIMFPLLDQCWADEVEFIHEPIYRYTRRHSLGTLARFGKSHKEERLEWLRTRAPKPKLNPSGAMAVA